MHPMVAYITLRGFQCYRTRPTINKFSKPGRIDGRLVLIGPPVEDRGGGMLYECVSVWVSGQVADRISLQAHSKGWALVPWEDIPKETLEAFYRTLTQ